MKPQLTTKNHQQGSMLLEALIGILIFSAGIIALVGLQAAAIRNATDAKNRTDAAFLANKVIGQMWATAPANLASSFGTTSGAGYLAWKGEVNAALPGGVAPAITFAPGSQANGLRVTVTVSWRLPSEPAGSPPHRHIVISEINQCPLAAC